MSLYPKHVEFSRHHNGHMLCLVYAPARGSSLEAWPSSSPVGKSLFVLAFVRKLLLPSNSDRVHQLAVGRDVKCVPYVHSVCCSSGLMSQSALQCMHSLSYSI